MKILSVRSHGDYVIIGVTALVVMAHTNAIIHPRHAITTTCSSCQTSKP
jgi:hypothetical protein